MSHNLEHLEFDIPCEIPACDRPAKFMGKGCEDTDYVPVCIECMQSIVYNFYQLPMVQDSLLGPVLILCPDCHAPLVRGFNAHFHVAAI